ncbi:MAG: hypothetical protein MGU50_09415 [Trichodesmium sp. MAG_R02]|nr:hypothetical protein [Trichodesmium sp. MAG_R02]
MNKTSLPLLKIRVEKFLRNKFSHLYIFNMRKYYTYFHYLYKLAYGVD